MLSAATTEPATHPLLAERWSTRAFDARAELAEADLAALLEAARWAPSASNTQPWRFLVALRGTPEHAALVERLADGNRVWAGAASALVLVAAAQRGADGRALPWARYDTGGAVAAMVTEAQARGLAAHQMGGFDAPGLADDLALPADVEPLVVVALGRHDPAAALPEHLRERETAPRTRLPLDELLLRPAPALRRSA